MANINPAFKLRKEGKLKEAEKVAREYLEKDPNNEWNKKALGWVLFEKLKQALRKQKKLNKWNKIAVKEFLRLNIPTPDILYSNFLKVLIRFYKKGDNSALFQIYNIVKNHTIEDLFRNEDFLRRKKGRVQINSLVESVSSTLAHHSLNKKEIEALEFTLNWLEQAEVKFPDNLNLPYFRARILIELKQNDKAIPILQKLTAMKNDWHLWGYLGIAYQKIDVQKSIQYLCKAVITPKDPYLTIKFRIELAKSLFDAQKYQEGSSELKYITKLLEIRKLPTKEEVEELKKHEKFVANAPEELPQSFYEELSKDIEPDYSFLDLVHGIVVDVNPTKRKTAFVENGIIYLGDWAQHPELEKLQKGQKVDIRALRRKNYFGIVKKIEKVYQFNPEEFPLVVGVWTRDQQKRERGFFYSSAHKRIPIPASEVEGLAENINDIVIGLRLFTYRSFERKRWRNKELYFIPKVMKEKESEVITKIKAKIKYVDPEKKYYIAETETQDQVFIPGPTMNFDAMEGYEFEFQVYEGFDRKKKNRSYRALSVIRKLSPIT
ncbi:MAG: tetratricopeptide repeat protein [Leptospiraceae bacterium]|nr:tetratricopeptide repeat protein [Leptospiraceae bacterium]MDW7976459.1 tetratricopeptide repeat protein [Leptospiraceae bacterium]